MHCSMLCASLEQRGVWGRMGASTCVAESLHCSPETITTLSISYIPIQNKKFKAEKQTTKQKIYTGYPKW